MSILLYAFIDWCKRAGVWLLEHWRAALVVLAAVVMVIMYSVIKAQAGELLDRQETIRRQAQTIIELEEANHAWVEEADRWNAAVEEYEAAGVEYRERLSSERVRRLRAEDAVERAESRLDEVEAVVTSEDCTTAVAELAEVLGWMSSGTE